jgi:hypothetical protein
MVVESRQVTPATDSCVAVGSIVGLILSRRASQAAG